MPRAWLAEGETLALSSAPTSYGRVDLALSSAIDSRGLVAINFSATPAFAAAPPPGGLVLRARPPGTRRRLVNATVGGAAWPVDPSRTDAIHLPAATLAQPGFVARLQAVELHFGE